MSRVIGTSAQTIDNAPSDQAPSHTLRRVHPAPATVMVSISALRPADSPRRGGVDPEHVSRLAAVDRPLPPILVDRRTMHVVDGTHRLLAAIESGETFIEVEYFDGSADDAFLRAVEANVRHGLPLSRSDRRTAARRIVVTHPHLSDRAIADAAGLSAKTVAAVRRCLGAVTGQPAVRLGRDGKRHPLDKAAGRNRAAALIAEQPDASLREIARLAGVSPATVSDVRKRLAQGAPAALPPTGAEPATPRPTPVPVAVVPEPERTDPGPLLAQLSRDPSLRTREDGRRLLRLLLRAAAAEKDGLAELAAAVPAHCVDSIHGLARRYADMWLDFAQQVG